jgi:5-methylthioadenosine/S-adenosylhomocysteine deaminase
LSKPRRAIIRGGRLLDIATHGAEAADIFIEAGTIRELGPPGLVAPDDAIVVTATDRLLVPGLVNAHTHAHGALAKGLVEDRVPLEVFLSHAGVLSAGRGTEDKYLSALLSAVELVRKGCTAAYDLAVEFPVPSVEGIHAVAQAYFDVGMRAVIAPMMADRTLYEALPGLIEAMPQSLRDQVRRLATAPYEASIAVCRQILRDWPFDRTRVRPALAPTIPLHCSDEFLRACHRLAAEHAVGLQTHLAETKAQAVLGVRRYGKSLVSHLGELGVLDETLSAAHAIWVTPDDISRLADAGVKVAHNPLSNLRLGSGVAPVRQMLDRGVTVGIGTDAGNTSDTQNMFEATRLAAYLSRLTTPDYGQWLSVEEAFAAATLGSARVLGMGERIGRLAPGFAADIVFLDLGHINYVPLSDAAIQLVNGEGGMAVDSVMIDGRMVLQGKRLLTVDEDKLRRDAEAAIGRLRAANAGTVANVRAFGEVVGAFCLGQARTAHPAHRALREEDYSMSASAARGGAT